jgi:hypothetical protein
MGGSGVRRGNGRGAGRWEVAARGEAMQQPARLEGGDGARATRTMALVWCATKRALVTTTRAMAMTATRAMATAMAMMAMAMRLVGDKDSNGKEVGNGEQQRQQPR